MKSFTNLKKFIDKHIKNSTNQGTLDVFPLGCGVGKSQYIKYKISDCLNDGTGIIIVTDSVNRLNDYISTDNDDLTAYISRNKTKIAILNADNINEEVKTLDYKSIVLLTTQRYFSMTREEIAKLTEYRSGRRLVVLFDERPYLYENIRIDIAVVDMIDIAIHSNLDNNVNQAEKEWLCTQWQTFISRFKVIVKELESQNQEYQYDIWYDKLHTIAENDEEFLRLINKYRKNLNINDCTLYKKLLAIVQMAENGARFISYKKSKSTDNCSVNVYENYFSVIVDNTPKILNVGAKCFVLDGTSSVMPDYDADFVNMVDCSAFQRTFGNLTIKFIDMPYTAKNKLCGKDGNSIIKHIKDYADSLPYAIDGVFSFKDCSKTFKEHFAIYDYFGNIKGKNEYNQLSNLLQVGVLRYPDIVYADIAGMNILQSNSKVVYKSMTDTAFQAKYKEMMYRYIAADIEQNLFRSKIRHADCKDKVIYTILMNCREYNGVIEIIRQRFPKAKIEIESIPPIFLKMKTENRKNKNESVSQKIIAWITSKPKGTIFNVKEMLIELNISQQNFNKAKEKNRSLRQIFLDMKTEKRGYYKA